MSVSRGGSAGDSPEGIPEPLARETAEILGAREEGEAGERLEDLFLRFQAQVPYQSAARPNSPEELLRGFVDAETGGEGDERAAAFFALARALGHGLEIRAAAFPVGSRLVALARPGGRLLLVDPGFPLPCLVPLDRPGEEIPTGYGKLRPSGEGESYRLVAEARGRSVEVVRLDPGTDAFIGGSGVLPHRLGPRDRFRLLDDRLLRWRAGRLEVTEGWSRLTHPLGGGEKEILEALFRVPCSDIGEIAPDPEPAVLSVYDLSPLPKALLEERAGSSRGSVEGAGDGRVEGSLLGSRRWRFEAQEGGTRIRLTARLAGLPPRGPTEPVRKTLVFLLATEVLDLSRD